MSDKQIPDHYPGKYYQPLFDLMSQEHGLTLLETQMADIIYVVNKMQALHPSESAGVKGAVWVKASKRLPDEYDAPGLFYKLDGIRVDGELQWVDNKVVFEYKKGSRYKNETDLSRVTWLDESQPPTAAGDGKEDAEWKSKYDELKHNFDLQEKELIDYEKMYGVHKREIDSLKAENETLKNKNSLLVLAIKDAEKRDAALKEKADAYERGLREIIPLSNAGKIIPSIDSHVSAYARQILALYSNKEVK